MGADAFQHVACPSCGQRYPWRDGLSRRKLRCICKAKFRMPAEPSQRPTLLEHAPADATPDRPAPGQPTQGKRRAPRHPPPASPGATDAPATEGYALAAPEANEPPPRRRARNAAPAALSDEGDADAPPATCPSCQRQLRPGAKLCVECGIDVATGRSMITSEQVNENLVHANAEPVIRGVSFAVPFGLYPLASEAYGAQTPWTIRAIAVLTLIVSAWFLVYLWTGAEGLQSHKQWMLWPQSESTATHLRQMYSVTDYGDMDALVTEIEAIDRRRAEAEADTADSEATTGALSGAGEAPGETRTLSEEEQFQRMLEQLMHGGALAEASDETVREAHENLAVSARAVGEFRWYQLVTHALLHGGILHLAGNMLFLLVFGLRVNALVGNIAAAALYPVLAVAAALAHMLSTAGEPPVPMLGASGAIWGLAGMYLVLFPVHRVYNAVWFRWPVFPLVFLMHLHMKIFACRGFWIVLLFVSFDVLAVAMGWHGATAHWAHLGGFIAGVTIALALLIGRVVDAGGGDVLSVVLGKSAWALIGSPAERARKRVPAA